MTTAELTLLLSAVNTLLLPALYAIVRHLWSIERRLLRLETKARIDDPDESRA